MIFLGEIFTVFSWRKNIEHKHEESIYFPNIQTDFSRDEIIPKDMVLILWNKVILQAPINLSANYENFSNYIFQIDKIFLINQIIYQKKIKNG